MSNNIFDLFNNGRLLDKHGKKIHLKLADGSVTWNKLGDDVKRRILSIEANISALYAYVRQLIPGMEYYTVTFVESSGIRYNNNYQTIAIKGQPYNLSIESIAYYNLSDIELTIGNETFHINDINSLEERFAVDTYTETELAFTILNVDGNITVRGIAEEISYKVDLELGQRYAWEDLEGIPISSFYAKHSETNTYYIVTTTGWAFGSVTAENCNAVAGTPDSQGRIPVVISNVTGDATVSVSLMETVVGISKQTPITLSHIRVLIEKEGDTNFSEIDFSERFTVPRGTSFTLRLEPIEHYYLPSNYSAGYSIVSGTDTDEGEFDLNSGTNYYEASFDGNEDVIVFGDAASLMKSIQNTTNGFTVTISVNGGTPENIAQNSSKYVIPEARIDIQFTCNSSYYIPNDDKPRATQTGISDVEATGSNGSFSITNYTVNENVIIRGKAYEENGIYYGEYAQGWSDDETQEIADIEADLEENGVSMLENATSVGNVLPFNTRELSNDSFFIGYPKVANTTDAENFPSVEFVVSGNPRELSFEEGNSVVISGWHGKDFVLWEFYNPNPNSTLTGNLRFKNKDTIDGNPEGDIS